MKRTCIGLLMMFYGVLLWFVGNGVHFSLLMKVVREQEIGKDKYKVFIECGGADSPRPVQVARNKSGQWKLIEYSSLCVGVKKPASEEGDF